MLWMLILIVVIIVVIFVLILLTHTGLLRYIYQPIRLLDPNISGWSVEHSQIYNAYLQYISQGHIVIDRGITRDRLFDFSASGTSLYDVPEASHANAHEASHPNVPKILQHITYPEVSDYSAVHRPKIAIVSASIGNREFAKYSRQRLEEYCNLHGYDLYYFTSIVDDSMPPIWQKIPMVRNIMYLDVKNIHVSEHNIYSFTQRDETVSRPVYYATQEHVDRHIHNSLQKHAYQHAYNSSQETRYIDRPIYNSTQETRYINRPVYDAVMWIDDDIYITNMSIGIESILTLCTKDIIFTADRMCYEPTLVINSGIFIVRNTKVGREYMDDMVLNSRIFNGKYLHSSFHEQSVATYLFYTKYHPYSIILQAGVLQSFLPLQGTSRDKRYSMKQNRSTDTLEDKEQEGIWKSGDFALHLCGESSERRASIFSQLSMRSPDEYALSIY